ncbi:MAG: cyclopropane-fatty-acyl-phospholipid synthase [Deltaproteobacteria bacterium HGW-Deltaproteobacteria-13]|jgi:cyclopropane-fatty-acyl-phospholipid synthase|nr:MAG: cyclopropane-fatty-acyl-phospholipid synthase [Deltaproteobacteria bacterium HGW-Deltaproteobacteria-13]
MMNPRHMIEEILEPAGIHVNGSNPWDIQVTDDRIFSQVLKSKNLGLGEAYMEGWWNCRQLDELIYRILKFRLDEKIKTGYRFLVNSLFAVLVNMQSKKRSPIVAEQHYDLDNNLFMSFLGAYNQYSCAYFDGTEDLNDAQIKKMELICKKIGLRKSDRVLDIGCGWGGFAGYMAEHYGCNVTAINISSEQIRHAKDLCKNLPVKILFCDYRDLEGTFDKIISVGMLEHVGQKNYKTFAKAVHRCLGENGIFLLHTIGRNDSDVEGDPWMTKYIFPNGMMPSITQISKAIEGLFVIEDLHNLGPHYEKTLLAWHENFQKSWDTLKNRYDDKFKRMWDYYLLSCAGAFRARDLQLWQIVLTRYGTSQPFCRY